MSEWKECKLGEVAEVQTGPFGSQLKNEQYITGGTPVVTVEHITNFRIIDFDYPSVTDEDKNRLSKYLLKSGDIVFTRVGSVDLSAFVKPHQNGWMFSSRMLRVRPNQDVDARFLSYYFQQNKFREYILNISVGATMPSINTGILKGIPISYPPLPEQRTIASVLSSLDNKIDLLHRQNQTLEAMAETLFRQWFVEEAEEGWEVCRLREVCSLITDGKHGDCQNETKSGYFFISVKDVKDGNVCYDNAREITKSDFEETHRRTNLTAGDVLITNSGTIGRMAIIKDIPETRRTTFQKSFAILKPNIEKITSKFLYCLLQSNLRAVVELAGGTTQQNLLLGDLRDFEFKCPDNLAIKEFDENVTPCFEKMFVNDTQIHTLTRLRDTLLPKLMSGEVRVGD